MVKVIEEREEDIKAKSIELIIRNGQIQALEKEVDALKVSLKGKE